MAAQRNKADKGEQPRAQALRRLPAVDRIVQDADVMAWAESAGYDRAFVVEATGAMLQAVRAGVLAGDLDEAAVQQRLADPARAVAEAADRLAAPHLRHVINATGVIIHTNLGRAPWPAAAASRVAELSQHYLNLELDLATGGRGQRGEALQRLAGRLLPGASVAVVNNCAAAVLLALNTLAEDREVIVARGQLVEIGGSFRVPEVIRKSGARLREVGTTNRTRAADYASAIGEQTGALLSVHPSNYRVVGFTEEASLEQLAELGVRHDVPVIEDFGGGCLIDLRELGIDDEPTVQQRLAAGADLVMFSGDKLLGGPQAGFIAGKPELVERVRNNPLYRALRLDKATTLALEATLAAYVTGRLDDIPTVRMLRARPDELERRAHRLADRLGSAGVALPIAVVEVASRIGGGAAPCRDLPSRALAIEWPAGPDDLMARLRVAEPPVIGRIVNDQVLLDVRTILPDEDETLVSALAASLSRPPVRG
jgi:L-seryl-tRNA(Ser) seleniumtransferase